MDTPGKASKALDDTLLETRLFINGQLRPYLQYMAASSPARMCCHSPEDNSLITEDIHKAVKEDVDAAVAAARIGFTKWRSTPPAVRTAVLHKFADLIEAHGDKIGLLEAACAGKPVQAFHGFEKPLATSVFRYYAGWCGKLGGESFPAEDGTGLLKIVQREAIGVCAAIVAFNGPIGLMAIKAAPCLAAGNSIIIKASEKSPLSSLYLGKLVNEAGFPPGVVNFISGDGETGALLSAHMDIDHISFTGSVGVGKKVAQAAAQSNLKRVVLELGGKSPSIIFPDANLDIATQWCAKGITAFSGQMCFASSRLYVHRDIKAEVVDRMKAYFEDLYASFGDSLDETTVYPPMVDQAHFESVSGFIDRGKKEATLVTGGERLFDKGCWIRPTIFVDPETDARISKDEIFGPVVVISSFTDEDEVVNAANSTIYGLHSAVFTQDINRAMRVAGKICSGTVCINCCATVDPHVPFGGAARVDGDENSERSVHSMSASLEGIEEYTETKSMLI
ncbi:hypothetical protein N7452_003670, partial [Penicillium brevicompactum]